MRIHLFEFEDLDWFPNTIRESMTDFLGSFLRLVGFYKTIIPLLETTLQRTKHNQIIDLCSGSGYPIVDVSNSMGKLKNVSYLLTDKYPNTSSYKRIQESSNGRINYIEEPINVKNVPSELIGLRTIFSAIHHFRPDTVKEILKDAVDNKMPIAVFDGGDKNILAILWILFVHPVIFLFITPFLKPVRLSRFVFTYLLPIIPICTIWDGTISILRLYQPKELLKIAQSQDHQEEYRWEYGKVRNKLGFRVSYLIGFPKKNISKR